MTREAPKIKGKSRIDSVRKGFGRSLPGSATYADPMNSSDRPRQSSSTDSSSPFLNQSTDVLLDDSTLSNAIELSDSISNPAVEEAAILYSYGELPPAIEVLRNSIQADQSNFRNAQAWLMLLELYKAIGNVDAFDRLAADYERQFGSVPEPFHDAQASPRAGRSTETKADTIDLSELGGVVFEGPLNAGITERLENLKRLASVHRALYVDFTKVSGVETQGAELVLRMLSAFAKSNRILVVRGADNLLAKLVTAVETRRNQVATFIWMLMFDLFRLTGRQDEFESKSIEYLTIFEGSLPAWDPYPGNVHVEIPQPVEEVEPPAPASVALSGVLVGKAERELAELSEFASTSNRVCVDCSALSRIDFTAAGALLNWAVGLQKHNKTAEFRGVSHLVSALLIVMGIHEVALIERR